MAVRESGEHVGLQLCDDPDDTDWCDAMCGRCGYVNGCVMDPCVMDV